MTREKALSHVAPNLSYFNDCKPAFAIKEYKKWVNKIYDDFEKEKLVMGAFMSQEQMKIILKNVEFVVDFMLMDLRRKQMFKKVLIALLIFSTTLSIADENFCKKGFKSAVSSDFSLVCVNGDEYLVFYAFRAGGLEKTGHRCKCEKVIGIFGSENFVFKNVKDN